jgi:hypothetical protein
MKVRLPLVIPAVILVLLGLLWVLQGAGVLAGSFMSGQKLWLVIGLVVALAGLGLGYLGLRRRAPGA